MASDTIRYRQISFFGVPLFTLSDLGLPAAPFGSK